MFRPLVLNTKKNVDSTSVAVVSADTQSGCIDRGDVLSYTDCLDYFDPKSTTSVDKDILSMKKTEERWSPKNDFSFIRILEPRNRINELGKKDFGTASLTTYALLKGIVYSSDSYFNTQHPKPVYIELALKKAYPAYLQQLQYANITANDVYVVIFVALPSFYWFDFVSQEIFNKLLAWHKSNQRDRILDELPELRHHIVRIEKNAKRKKLRNNPKK